jgi:hypothetical protein
MGPDPCWRVYRSVSEAFGPGRSSILDMDFGEFFFSEVGE